MEIEKKLTEEETEQVSGGQTYWLLRGEGEELDTNMPPYDGMPFPQGNNTDKGGPLV